MRIISYLKNSLGAVAIIVVLLIVQAATDLSLPHYTSNIVDVGIQQSGIEHAATDAMSAETFDALCMLGTDEDESTLRSAYSLGDDGLYHLSDAARKDLDALDDVVAFPLVAVRAGGFRPRRAQRRLRIGLRHEGSDPRAARRVPLPDGRGYRGVALATGDRSR